MEDELQWVQGRYLQDAIASTVCNMFTKKGSQKAEYPDKPYMTAYKEREDNGVALSKEEIKRQKEYLFARLNLMATNARLQKLHQGD